MCIGFGFRNLTIKTRSPSQYISEILRVLKPGGRFVIVESSQPAPTPGSSGFSADIRKIHRLFPGEDYLRQQAPPINTLPISAANYYGAEELRDFALKIGFGHVTS
jgi:demethylmenaquinone methyltransferase/2-methoxy-6-polyprenyl-1,4-benzoquinol methylase